MTNLASRITSSLARGWARYDTISLELSSVAKIIVLSSLLLFSLFPTLLKKQSTTRRTPNLLYHAYTFLIPDPPMCRSLFRISWCCIDSMVLAWPRFHSCPHRLALSVLLVFIGWIYGVSLRQTISFRLEAVLWWWRDETPLRLATESWKGW